MSESVSSIRVDLGERSYDVRVGSGVRAELPQQVDALGEGDVLVVHDGPDRPGPTKRLRLSEGQAGASWNASSPREKSIRTSGR